MLHKGCINPNNKKSTINKDIYGHFSEHLGRCIYEGIYVGEDSTIPNINGIRKDVLDALKNISVPVLRWPGGCFADEYHWKDGIGEKSSRKRMINTNWGGVIEDNSFGTHEFMELCSLLGCDPYINANVGSSTVSEVAEWIEYMTFDGESPMALEREKNGRKEPWKFSYLGVGNENWGCGGSMTPDYYANLYRRYQTYCKNYGENKLYKIACGPNCDDYEWTDKLMSNLKDQYADAISLHYYTVPHSWEEKGSALGFDTETYYDTLAKASYMDELIEKHLEIMSKYDKKHKVKLIVDEWGTWYDVEEGTNPGFLYQQNSMRDALVAAITLNIFNRHSDRIIMANLAQTVNVLQAVILTEGEKLIKTPTYYVFEMYKNHQNSTLVDCFIENTEIGTEKSRVADISSSASVNDKGELTVTISNASLDETNELEISITETYNEVSAKILTGDKNAHNDFENPDVVKSEEYNNVSYENGILKMTLPPCSVVNITLK